MDLKSIKIESGSDESKELTNTKDCEICWKHKGNYTCPRCNLAYCSLDCYRDPVKHLSCSELFYKDQVVNELKTLKIDEKTVRPEFLKENRMKMVEILKRSAKQLEFDPELDEDDMLQNLEDIVQRMGQTNGLTEQADEAQLEKEIDHEEVVELLKKIVNKNLVKHASDIDTSKASQYIYLDILQSAFVYAFLASLYDVDGECLDRLSHETKLDSGFLTNWLQIQQTFANHSKANRTLISALGEKIHLTVNIVSNEELDPVHRNFLNKKFFGEIIDDVALFCRHPSNFLIKIVSFLYGQLEIRLVNLKRRVQESADQSQDTAIQPGASKTSEKPLNVFHLNRQAPNDSTKDSSFAESKSRVKIIRTVPQIGSTQQQPPSSQQPVQTPKKLANFTTKTDAIQETRVALRRLEFYFKWLQVNKSSIESPDMKSKLQRELDDLKQLLATETSRFDEEKKFVESNLDFIKAKQQKEDTQPPKLIEEL